jgi:hypothetical protein
MYGWSCRRGIEQVFLCPITGFPAYRSMLSVYGSENVSSGASSDIRSATRTAEDMVKVIGLRFDKLTSGFEKNCLILEMGLF